jgi:hypothetical protein
MTELGDLIVLLQGRKIMQMRRDNSARIDGWNQAIDHVSQVVRNRIEALKVLEK